MSKPLSTKFSAVAIAAFAFVASSASAADLRAGGATYYGDYARAGTVDLYEFYDGEDPVYVRRYWREPFLGRHYFPAAFKRPGYGRVERIPPAERKLPPRAEDYFRYWSTLPGYNEDWQYLPDYGNKPAPQK